jgi:hypothetical protein
MHIRWAQYFEDMGILIGKWKCKNPLCFMFDDNGELNTERFSVNTLYNEKKSRIYGDDEPIFRPKKCKCGYTDFEYIEAEVEALDLNIRGHADLILKCDNLVEEMFKGVRITYNKDFLPMNGKKVVGDMKSIGSKSWENQLQKKGPHKEYLIQLTIYIHILNCDYGIIMYENKDNSELMWFYVPRNDKWWEIIQFQTKQMIEMAMPDSKGKVKLPPPRYATRKSYPCSGCEFKNLCHKSPVWDNPNLEQN